jgi:Zn-finger nucleic acid-binding protein
MTEATTLTCPKCGGSMHTYERNGIAIEQCGECRGIFLDRGELERLIDAEASYAQRGDDRGSSSRSGLGGGHPGGSHGGRMKRGFLGELFD